MTHNKDPEFETHTEQKETILILSMIGVEKLYSVLIVESCPRFLESNTVLLAIRPVLSRIPLKPQLKHTYNVQTNAASIKATFSESKKY